MLNLCLVTHNRFAPAFNGAVIVRAVIVSTSAKRSVCQRRATYYLQVFRSSWSV